jgi:hypothetical protein
MTVEFDVVATAAVAAATLAEEVLEACFFLGIGEDATSARRERDRMTGEKRIFAVVLGAENKSEDGFI